MKRYTKKFSLLVAALVLLLGIASSAMAAKYVIKAGIVAAPTAPYSMAAVEVSKAVKELTKDEVDLQVFPSGQLGNQSDLVQGVVMGTVDIVFSSSAALTQFAPKVQLIDMPFIFRDRAHIYGALDDPKIAADMFGQLKSVGRYICTWENGIRQLVNAKNEIRKPADSKGLKMRTMESNIYIEMFKAIGANPTPMAYGELFTALQQKTVDGCDQTTNLVLFDRFYEVQKYLTLTNHSYSPEIVVISESTYKRVPAEYMKIVEEQLIKFKDWNRKMCTENEENYLKELEKLGMVITRLTPEEHEAFKTAMLPVWAKFEDKVGKDLLERVVNYGK